MSLRFWLFRGEVCGLGKMWPRGEIRTRWQSGIRHRIDIANFGGDIKLFLCVAYWMYLTHIQLGSLGLRRIDKGSNELYSFSLMVPCCCCYWSTDDRRLYRTKSFCKKAVFGSFPNFCSLESRSRLNRISHPDWVKLCVDLNYAPNQNTKFPSATHVKIAFYYLGRMIFKKKKKKIQPFFSQPTFKLVSFLLALKPVINLQPNL